MFKVADYFVLDSQSLHNADPEIASCSATHERLGNLASYMPFIVFFAIVIDHSTDRTFGNCPSLKHFLQKYACYGSTHVRAPKPLCMDSVGPTLLGVLT